MLIIDKLTQCKDFSRGEELIAEFIIQAGESLKDYSARGIAESVGIHIYSYGTALNIAESFKEKMLKVGKNVYY